MSRPAASAAAKLGLLAPLYFSQGLPFGFFTQALPVLLRQQGRSLAEIGLSSLLAIPWALKFLWAPALDRHYSPALGRRRSWILPLQIASSLVLAGLASLSESGSTTLLMTAILALNLLAATQDIATDGLAVDLLDPHQRGLGNGVQVAGYRVGMLVGGGAILMLHDWLGFGGSFLLMATLIAAGTVPVLLVREPAAQALPSPSAPSFLRRPGSWRWLALLVTYKFGDAFATAMLRPFLADAGLGLADVGWLLGVAGFSGGLLGALVGGALVNRLGRRPALVLFGILQAAAIGAYAALAHFGAAPGRLLVVVCGAEHLTGGMATAALFTCMMDACTRARGGADYTIQASAVVIATGVAGAVSGFSAQHLGYRAHFALATLLSLAALAVVARAFPEGEPACA